MMVVVAAAAGSTQPSTVQALLMFGALCLVGLFIGWKLRDIRIYSFLSRDHYRTMTLSARHKLYKAMGNEELAKICSKSAAMERENYALTLLTVLGKEGRLPRSPDELESILEETRRLFKGSGGEEVSTSR